MVLTAVNFICGLIVKNRYIALDPPTRAQAEKTFGFFAPRQDKIILYPGLPDYHVTINDLGFRITSPLASGPRSLADIQNKWRILCLGDSETFGNHVGDEDSYPYQLQQLLDRKGFNASVLNAGIGSATIPDYLDFLERKGAALQPAVVVVQFFDNDVGQLADWKRPIYEEMIEKSKFSLERQLKLLNVLRVFRKWELGLRYQHRIKKTRDPRVREILRTDSQTLEDILWVSANQYAPINVDPKKDELKIYWQQYFKDLSETHEWLTARDVRLIFVIYPSICTLFDYGRSNYQDILIPYLNKEKIPFVDLRQRFLPIKNEFLKLYNDPPPDYHLSPWAKKITAEEVYKLLEPNHP